MSLLVSHENLRQGNLHRLEWIQVGEREILSKCCWALNKGESVIPSLTVCPQHQTFSNIYVNVPVAFTGCGPLRWTASVFLHGFLLLFFAISVNRMSSKNWTLVRSNSLSTGHADATDRHMDNCSTTLQISHFSLINIRLEELTQKHRPISGWLVLGEMKLQWVPWKQSNMENGAPRRKWCKITIVSRCINKTPYDFGLFKGYLWLYHNLAC